MSTKITGHYGEDFAEDKQSLPFADAKRKNNPRIELIKDITSF